MGITESVYYHRGHLTSIKLQYLQWRNIREKYIPMIALKCIISESKEDIIIKNRELTSLTDKGDIENILKKKAEIEEIIKEGEILLVEIRKKRRPVRQYEKELNKLKDENTKPRNVIAKEIKRKEKRCNKIIERKPTKAREVLRRR